jgi:hypothetical protein
VIPAVLALILAIGQGGVGTGQVGQDAIDLQLENGRDLVGMSVTVSFVATDSIKAARVLRALEGPTPLPGLPPGVPSGVLLVLAPDEAQFVRLTGGAAPDWGAGVALPARSTIVVPSFVSERGAGSRRGTRSGRVADGIGTKDGSFGSHWHGVGALSSLSLFLGRGMRRGRVPRIFCQPRPWNTSWSKVGPEDSKCCSDSGKNSEASNALFGPRLGAPPPSSKRIGGSMSKIDTDGCSYFHILLYFGCSEVSCSL